MDCREVEQVISALSDGEQVDDAERAEAASHCADCPECARFKTALAALAAAPAPKAPPELADRVLTAAEAAGREPATAAVAATAAAPAGAPGKREYPPWLTRGRLWAITAVGATAAVLLAIAIGFGIYQSTQANQAEVDAAMQRALGGQAAPAGQPASATAEAGAATSGTSASTAPNYVLFQNRVYSQVGTFDSTESSVTTIGTVTSSLSTNGAPQQHAVLLASGAPGSGILVRFPDDTLQSFVLVSRNYNGKPYLLESGDPLQQFGTWPTLPGRFNPPANADGAPTFQLYGEDSSGMNVYVPPGAQPSNGFAVPPGTSTSDPAAGNPNWTWWTPL
jgi:negative regulator of sigma E activity